MLTQREFRAPRTPEVTGNLAADIAALRQHQEDTKKWFLDILKQLNQPGALSISQAAISADAGIAFPPTQIPSSDPNTLDDYKEVTSLAVTVTSGTGTLTTVSGSISYTKVGRQVTWQATISITTNGTGATDIRFTFPFTVVGIAPISGFETSTGYALSGYINGTQLLCYKVDGTYPGASSRDLRLSGTAHV